MFFANQSMGPLTSFQCLLPPMTYLTYQMTQPPVLIPAQQQAKISFLFTCDSPFEDYPELQLFFVSAGVSQQYKIKVSRQPFPPKIEFFAPVCFQSSLTLSFAILSPPFSLFSSYPSLCPNSSTHSCLIPTRGVPVGLKLRVLLKKPQKRSWLPPVPTPNTSPACLRVDWDGRSLMALTPIQTTWSVLVPSKALEVPFIAMLELKRTKRPTWFGLL